MKLLSSMGQCGVESDTNIYIPIQFVRSVLHLKAALYRLNRYTTKYRCQKVVGIIFPTLNRYV